MNLVAPITDRHIVADYFCTVMRSMPAKSANYFSEAGFTRVREKSRATFILLFATAGEGEVVHHGTEN
jgi:hypothetical protein